MQNLYNIHIFERYSHLKKNKTEFDNNDLWKIFEYYTCILLSQEFNSTFYEYDDITPEFKETHNLSRYDTGIDCSNLTDTIVQCKLRKKTLTLLDCATFFASQNIYDNYKTIIRWDNLIIARNDDCSLSKNLLDKQGIFQDKPFNKQELINYCENLIINPPSYPISDEVFELRDYQIESIDLIKNSKKNVIINLPTGTGKNSVIIHSFQDNNKYLILVPRIILMDQLKLEIIKHKPFLKHKIQLIGDSNINFDENKLITICVFNSVHIVEKFNFQKIFIDEAHHIERPEIYDDLNDYESIDEELGCVKSYTEIIRSLSKYNNNVYLSATIDPIDNFDYYSKDLRTMIDLKYLCDYQIHVPIFNNDLTNKNICEHLLKNYRNIIIYCNSQQEGKQFNELMNQLLNNCSAYVDCNTSKKERNTIINKYKTGEIQFLVNVRILVEGFDAPISKGVCFIHLPTNKTTLIQIIGRCLRLHNNKTIAHVILPFSSKEDEKNICNFLKVMAKNDSRIKKSYENKKTSGYISIEKEIEENNDDDDIEFKYCLVYDSMCVLQNGNEIWLNKLDKVKQYIDENHKRPSKDDENLEIKKLCNWLNNQNTNYKNKTQIMANELIYIEWTNFITEYKQYFLSNIELWYEQLNQLKQYIDENHKKPSLTDENNEIKKLCYWLNNQNTKYQNNKQNKENSLIYEEWTNFINEYKQYFLSNYELWYQQLNNIKDYINENHKKPSLTDENNEIKNLCYWLNTQNTNSKTKKYIMRNEEIQNEWSAFKEEYKKYLMPNEELWYEKLNQLKQYIDENHKKPSRRDENLEIKNLCNWLNHQHQKYKNKKQIMADDEISNEWSNFINEYKQYF